MTNTPNLVHEADAQRHHVRVKLPAQIEINGVSYEMVDWSTGGARVKLPPQSDATVFADGKVHNAKLVFNLDSFILTVPMTVELRHADQGFIGLRYIDMSKEQVVIMQHLVGSYVTGTLTSVDDVIHVMSRNNFTKARTIPKREENLSFSEKLSLMAKRIAVPVISLLLIAYVATGVFEKKFVVTAEKAVVTGDAITVPATAGGVVSFNGLHNGDTVKRGDVLMTIQSEGGTIVGVDSPCDCVIEDRKVDSGSTVAKGGIVLRLIPTDTPLRVESYVSYKEAVRLAKGQHATIRFPGANQGFQGTINSITIGSDAEARARVSIKSEQTLPPEMVGTPVSVKINTASGKAKE